jgi:hypothetical protein
VINIKKQEFILIQDKQVYNFIILGFNEKQYYGEVYLTENGRKTSIHRGSDLKKVIKSAKK